MESIGGKIIKAIEYNYSGKGKSTEIRKCDPLKRGQVRFGLEN